MWHDGWGSGQWIAAISVMMVVFWGLIVVGVVALVRSTRADGHTHAPPTRSNDARRILDERFARGEIDADEYAHRRDVLDRS
jgi:putative membrane protein